MWLNDLIKKVMRTDAEEWLFTQVAPQRAPRDGILKELVPREEYIYIEMKCLRIVHVRKAFDRFYGAVHSFASLDQEAGSAEFSVVTKPGRLEQLDQRNIDRVVQVNIPLLGPIPYVGGKLALEMGLFSIKSADLAAPFLSVLQDLSSLAGVSFIGAALPYAEPLKKGINLLVNGSGDTSSLEIGISTSNHPLRTGYYVVARVSKDTLRPAEVHIGEDFRLLDGNKKPVKDVPYIVYQIKSSPRRNDYFKIPEIVAAHATVKDAVKKRDATAIREALSHFKLTVLTSGDLIMKDAIEIYKEVENDVAAILAVLEEPVMKKQAGFRSIKNLRGTAHGTAQTPAQAETLPPLRTLRQLKIYSPK